MEWKKNNPENRPQKYANSTEKFGTIFEENCLSSLILNFVGLTSQPDQNFKSQEIYQDFIYIYIDIYFSIYWYSVEHILKWKKLKDTFDHCPSAPPVRS